jgi:hypothetical protein
MTDKPKYRIQGEPVQRGTIIESKRGDSILVTDFEGLVEVFRWMAKDPTYQDAWAYLARCGVVYRDADGKCHVKCSEESFIDGCVVDCDKAEIAYQSGVLGSEREKRVRGQLNFNEELATLGIEGEGGGFSGGIVSISGLPPYVDESYTGGFVEAILIDDHAYFRRFVKWDLVAEWEDLTPEKMKELGVTECLLGNEDE